MFQVLALCQENDFEAVSSSYYPIPTSNLTGNILRLEELQLRSQGLVTYMWQCNYHDFFLLKQLVTGVVLLLLQSLRQRFFHCFYILVWNRTLAILMYIMRSLIQFLGQFSLTTPRGLYGLLYFLIHGLSHWVWKWINSVGILCNLRSNVQGCWSLSFWLLQLGQECWIWFHVHFALD